MTEISAGKVKELRELTGLPMMECKKALSETGGDLRKAEELLRIKSGAKASKAADFLLGLVHGSAMFWAVALGPAVLLLLVRLFIALLRVLPTARND